MDASVTITELLHKVANDKESIPLSKTEIIQPAQTKTEKKINKVEIKSKQKKYRGENRKGSRKRAIRR